MTALKMHRMSVQSPHTLRTDVLHRHPFRLHMCGVVLLLLRLLLLHHYV